MYVLSSTGVSQRRCVHDTSYITSYISASEALTLPSASLDDTVLGDLVLFVSADDMRRRPLDAALRSALRARIHAGALVRFERTASMGAAARGATSAGRGGGLATGSVVAGSILSPAKMRLDSPGCDEVYSRVGIEPGNTGALASTASCFETSPSGGACG